MIQVAFHNTHAMHRLYFYRNAMAVCISVAITGIAFSNVWACNILDTATVSSTTLLPFSSVFVLGLGSLSFEREAFFEYTHYSYALQFMLIGNSLVCLLLHPMSDDMHILVVMFASPHGRAMVAMDVAALLVTADVVASQRLYKRMKLEMHHEALASANQ